MTTLPIPARAADIDAAWLTEALASTGAATGTVTSVAVEPVGVGIGLVGALRGVTPTYEGGTGPATLIAKFPAPEEGSRFVALVLGMYRNEVSFYRELSPRTALRHAECYYSDHDAETDAFVLAAFGPVGPAHGRPARRVHARRDRARSGSARRLPCRVLERRDRSWTTAG